MTQRLYYTDPYLREFDAELVDTVSHEGRTALVLDRSAFYPTSGGQPFDAGVFDDVRVLEVVETDDGRVLHVVDRAPSKTRLHGAIDWTRRFDHMQQHTGQHVLSAAFARVFDVRTESFHMGAEYSTIDLAREVSAAEIARAEDDANRIVWEDRPVTIRFAAAEEAAALGLRKEPKRGGTLRLIDVEGFDLSACGGTHVSRTGSIGVIATSAWEKLRGGTRVEFLCGGRALGRFREWRDVLTATTRHLSVTPPELAASVERMQGEAKSANRSIRLLQEQLATFEAQALLQRATNIDGRRVSVEALDGWEAPGLKALASAATTADPSAAVALFSRSTPPLVVVARGAACPIDAAAVLKALTARFGGKGGGKPELAQGGGLQAPIDDLMSAARQLLST